METAMLAKTWWVLATRGVIAIIFGVLTLLLPGVTLATLILLFGCYAIVDGIFSIIAPSATGWGSGAGGRCSWRGSRASARAS